MRECGDCTVCCTTLKVPELNKTEGVQCDKCTTKCSIYKDRPQSCRDFKCEWLKGYLPDNYSPDQSGFILEALPDIPVQVLSLVHGKDLTKNDTTVLMGIVNKMNHSIITTGGNALLANGATPDSVMKDVKTAAKRMGVM